MRALWKLGFTLAAAAALVLIAVGVTYLAVDARSLPSALGKVAGSSARHTERGLFAVMVGGLLLLLAIGFNQFQPGGALSLANGDPAGDTTPATGAVEANEAATTEYIGRMDEETEADPIMGLYQRRREERRAVEEAGGGESEGFELAEQELIEHASHGDQHTPSKIMRDAVGPDEESVDSVNGEADAEHLPD